MKNENIGKIISYRKQIANILKNNNYNYSAVITRAYIGEGFYVNHRYKVKKPLKIWGYDKHWAYGGVLKNNILPLSNKLGSKETALGIYLISYRSIKPRYNDFYYTIYWKNKQQLDRNVIYMKDGKVYRFMTNLDYEIFTDMYEVKDLICHRKLYFQELGKLNMTELIDKAYEEKHSGKYDKVIYESSFYGLNCKKMWEYDRPKDKEAWLDSLAETGYEYCRNKYTAIALFQTAYLRHEEWKHFKANMNNVIYMNTDSIFMDKDIPFENSKEVGHYGQCYNGDKIFFIRRNAYAVINEEETKFIKSVIGGIIDQEFTEEQISDLLNGETIKAWTLNQDGDKVYTNLSPDFIQCLDGECNNWKILKFYK